MLTIRREQMDVLGMDRTQAFENRMAQHIAEEYPAKYKKLGQPGTLGLIRKGIETARQYGITTEGPIAGLIELMVEFGEGFELSPDPKWAFEVLGHETLPAGVKVEVIGERFREMSGGRTVEAVED